MDVVHQSELPISKEIAAINVTKTNNNSSYALLVNCLLQRRSLIPNCASIYPLLDLAG